MGTTVSDDNDRRKPLRIGPQAATFKVRHPSETLDARKCAVTRHAVRAYDLVKHLCASLEGYPSDLTANQENYRSFGEQDRSWIRLTAWFEVSTLKSMDIQLSPAQQAFARDAIATGRLRREEDVVEEALALWESRERVRTELLASLDEAEASSPGGRLITKRSMQQLAEATKQRGRERLGRSE